MKIQSILEIPRSNRGFGPEYIIKMDSGFSTQENWEFLYLRYGVNKSTGKRINMDKWKVESIVGEEWFVIYQPSDSFIKKIIK